MNELDRRESKSLYQRATTHRRSLVPASRKRLFEAANYLLCQLALQIEELERTHANVSNGRHPEQPECTEQAEQPEQAEEKAPE